MSNKNKGVNKVEFKIKLDDTIEIKVEITFKKQVASISLKEFNQLSTTEMEKILFKSVDKY